jgi:anti-sigma factor RsiW
MTCKTTRDLLSPYLDGELPPRRRAAAADHLGGCAACRAALEELRALDTELRLQPRPEPGPRFAAAVMARLGEPRARRWSPLPAAAYTLLFLAVFGLGFWFSAGDAAPAAAPARVEVSLNAALAENRGLALLAVQEQTVSAIEEIDRAQE